MNILDFIRILDVDFYTGVPDSQLKPLCNYLQYTYGNSDHHIIAANEGNAVAIAAGYHMATQKIPAVYLQNSGLGNIINPVASLLNDKVYGIPCIFIIGWRGEPGVHDEPQHIFQGEVTLKLLETMDISYFVVDRDTSIQELQDIMEHFHAILKQGKSVAFVIKKEALKYEQKVFYQNSFCMNREEVIRRICNAAKDNIVVSTTGKASRELFEIREQNSQSHQYDFLTVGSMGHSSSIALEIAKRKKQKRIWCIDGDGAMLMHMGSMAVIGTQKPDNLIHVILNNAAHETVGGMPTAAGNIDILTIAKGCGYEKIMSACDYETLEQCLQEIANEKYLTLLEIKVALGARADLGRPTIPAIENKNNFMNYLLDI